MASSSTADKMHCKCGLWRAFLVLAAASAAVVSSAQLIKDDLMVVNPTSSMQAEDVRSPALADHRQRQRNATRSVGTLRRTAVAALANHQLNPLDVPENPESTVARIKKKIKHKRMWDEPEAQASEVQQNATTTSAGTSNTSKRPDRVKTRRRLVPPSSSTARTLRTVAATVLHEDPYYDFGKKIKHGSSSSSPVHGINAVQDLETRTSVRSPIVVATSEEERNHNYGTSNNNATPRTRTYPNHRAAHNSTSGTATAPTARRPESQTAQAECAYPRFTRRNNGNNKSRSQRDVRCLPVEPAAPDATRTTRILSTVVTSVSSVKGNDQTKSDESETPAELSAADSVGNGTTAAAIALLSSTSSPAEPTVSGYPKYLRNRYRNISLPEYLEITRVNQRRLNSSTPPPSPVVTTEAVRLTSAEITPSTAAAMSPADDSTETVDLQPITTSTAADLLHHHRSPTPVHSPTPPTDLQDFIYLNNGTTESETSQPPTADSAVEARQRRPLLQQKNVTRLLAPEHDVQGVVYPEGLATSTYLLTFLAIVPLVLVIVFAFKLAVQRNRKKVFDSSEYSSEYNRSPLDFNTITSSPITTKLPRVPQHIVQWPDSEKSAIPPPLPPVQTQQQQQQPVGRWEFPRDKLRLQTILGQGNFGQVWKAEADDISGHEGLTRLVAVKMVKEDAASREREDLIRELSIMQHLGSHPNVVTLLGCCTEKEPYLLIMEYVMYGKLLAFLRDRRTRSHYFNFSDSTASLTSRDLTVFAYCVARGMDFLVSKKIVHRDLAARNVLVDHNKLCKIADFGMSRNVRDTNQIYEQRHTKGALPIRWMAPESLHYSIFTYKTDVWSFGVLMWEIVTLGSTPYCTMGAREVMRRVREGYRLDKPAHCRSELFRVITKCWAADPAKRPSFAELKQELGALLENPEFEGSYVDLESLVDESDAGAKDRQLQQ